MLKLFCSRTLIAALVISATGFTHAAIGEVDSAAKLRAKYMLLKEPLRQNQFKRPLVLDSTEAQNRSKGDIYAVVDYPISAVNAGLTSPNHWCDVMLLHINTKYCRAMEGPAGAVLKVNIGKKTPEELSDAPQVNFNYKQTMATPEYFEIVLNAQEGPMGTSDFRILLEAVSLPNSKTFLHLTYSYAVNFAGRVAMQTYLKTVGSRKVGFTVIGKQPDGQPNYIGGVRGLIERNTMRYYLAIDSFLAAARVVPEAQFEQRIQNWFSAVERYPRQLHEVERGDYLEMKRAEYLRQQTVQ